MKKIVISIATVLAMVAGAGLSVSAQDVVPQKYIPVGGVGPAVAGSTSASSLPKKAQKFVEKLGQQVVSCEREYSSGEYDVKFDTGLEVDFDSKGEVVEIDAPGNGVLGADLIKEMVPGHLYGNLQDLNLENAVTSIESKKDGFKVEFVGSVYEEAFFSPSGDLIAMYYD